MYHEKLEQKNLYWAGCDLKLQADYKRIHQVLRLSNHIFVNTHIDAFSYDLVSYALFQPVIREEQQHQDQHILAVC